MHWLWVLQKRKVLKSNLHFICKIFISPGNSSDIEGVNAVDFGCTQILNLRAMSNLKILVCKHLENEDDEIEIVKNHFPNLMINTQDVNVAASEPLNPSLDSTSYSGLVDTTEGFFEIKCKRLNMFEDFVKKN